jgi:GTP cyclohydrolase II
MFVLIIHAPFFGALMKSSAAKIMPAHNGGVHSVLTSVDRVTSDLRRGEPVVVTLGSQAIWMMAAEAVDLHHIEAFTALSNDLVKVLLTGQRALRLGMVTTLEAGWVAESKSPLDAHLVGLAADPTLADVDHDASAQILASWKVKPASRLEMACVKLTKLSRLLPAALISNVTGPIPENTLVVTADDVEAYNVESAMALKIVSQAHVPLEDADLAKIVAFRPHDGGTEHLAIVVGKPDFNKPVMIRIHSECFTGDLLGSMRCDCGNQLRGAIALMASTGGGILLYMQQEGRGIGLINKLRAYQLQDSGLDTVDANLAIGYDEDEREYLPAAQMLERLGVQAVRLLTNNPRKVDSLTRFGIEVVERVAHVFPANNHNRGYLYTKATKGGHLFNYPDPEAVADK